MRRCQGWEVKSPLASQGREAELGCSGRPSSCLWSQHLQGRDRDPRLNWLVSFGFCDVKDGVLIKWRAIKDVTRHQFQPPWTRVKAHMHMHPAHTYMLNKWIDIVFVLGGTQDAAKWMGEPFMTTQLCFSVSPSTNQLFPMKPLYPFQGPREDIFKNTLHRRGNLQVIQAVNSSCWTPKQWSFPTLVTKYKQRNSCWALEVSALGDGWLANPLSSNYRMSHVGLQVHTQTAL